MMVSLSNDNINLLNMICDSKCLHDKMTFLMPMCGNSANLSHFVYCKQPLNRVRTAKVEHSPKASS